MSETSEVISVEDAKSVAKAAIGPDVTVLHFTSKRYSEQKIGFLGTHRRLQIQVKRHRDGDETIETIMCFIKSLPFDCLPQLDYVQESMVFDKETAFFETIVPRLTEGYSGPPWCARCYLVKSDTLCFEDLGSQGFSMWDKLFDEIHVRSTLRAIASFHASCIKAEAKLGKRLSTIYPDFMREVTFIKGKKIHRWFTSGVAVAITLAETMGLDASRLPEAFETIYEAVKPSEVKVNIINHGDLWSNNILFDNDLQCRLVDFQNYRYCPVSFDIAMFLYLCAPNDLRMMKEKELLTYYYQHLLTFLGNECEKAPSFEEVFQGYEERKIAACAAAVLYFPLTLMDGDTSREIVDSSDTFDKILFDDRRSIVLDNMKRDRIYKERIEAAVRELVKMSFLMNELPLPC